MVRTVRFWRSPVGWIRIEAGEEGVRGVRFVRHSSACRTSWPRMRGAPQCDTYVRSCLQQLHEYFAGTRASFDLPLAIGGTPFQRRVRKALVRIPYGETWTYRAVAAMVGRPNAARAVGQALHGNPLCLLLPCHRVVPSSGGIGGYAGGGRIKKWLLDHERSG